MDRQEKENSFWEQFTFLLTIIGLWLALPATFELFQRIGDNIAQLGFFSEKTFTIIKIVLDGCLLGVYIIGLILLISIGGSAFLAARTISATGKAINVTKRRGLLNLLEGLWEIITLRKLKATIKTFWVGESALTSSDTIDTTEDDSP